jgi:uncharacterized DUF497 family protein
VPKTRIDLNAFSMGFCNIDHIALHHVTPDEAEQVIENSPLELGQEERSGEQRILHLGETDAARVLLVAVTARGDKVRVVTAYPANRKLRTFYSEQKVTSDEEHSENP